MRLSLTPALALLPLAFLGACASRAPMMSAHECMARVMYFESNRTSEEGMVAVGTVGMNRVADFSVKQRVACSPHPWG